MGEQFVSQREFDRYREAVDRDIARLQRAHEDHEEQHEREADAAQHHREWTWQRILAVAAAAAGVVAAWATVLNLKH